MRKQREYIFLPLKKPDTRQRHNCICKHAYMNTLHLSQSIHIYLILFYRYSYLAIYLVLRKSLYLPPFKHYYILWYLIGTFLHNNETEFTPFVENVKKNSLMTKIVYLSFHLFQLGFMDIIDRYKIEVALSGNVWR